MIARVWRGVTSEAQADEYLDYLITTGVKECGAVAGNCGVRVLRRVGDGQAEFLFISLWDSLDAVRAFAGPDVEKAVYYPEDVKYLVELEPTIKHYEVVVNV
jgi:heme-degrading monooxygenase HmoA